MQFRGVRKLRGFSFDPEKMMLQRQAGRKLQKSKVMLLSKKKLVDCLTYLEFEGGFVSLSL